MEVSDTGAKVSHMDGCSAGVITQPLVMDSAGRFEVEGMYSSLQWLPELPPHTWAARFAGHVRGSVMDLEITHSSGSRVAYRLTHGARGTHEGVVC